MCCAQSEVNSRENAETPKNLMHHGIDCLYNTYIDVYSKCICSHLTI